MMQTSFPRPRTIAWNFVFSLNGNRSVLMPGDAPIGFFRLIEKHSTDRARGFTKLMLRESVECSTINKQCVQQGIVLYSPPRRSTRRAIRKHCDLLQFLGR